MNKIVKSKKEASGMFKGELLSIIKNRKILIPIIAVMFVPVLYAGMFLWAFWDPYDKLDELPVAVVNNDAGTSMDGNQLHLGDDLAKKLKKSKQFDFHLVTKKEAYKELEDQKYYMVIEIPKNFSENATTLLDKRPEKLELIYTPNESYNFLSAQIGGTAAERIKTAVSEQVTKTYAETMFSKISELADGVEKASDGAGQLSDGSVDLNTGSKELSDGLNTLAEKSGEFNNGMKAANDGSNKLAAGSTDIYNGLETLSKKTIEFNQGVKGASAGSQKITAGTAELKNGLAKADANLPLLIQGTEKVKSGAEQLKSELPTGIADALEKQLSSSAGDLASQIAEQTIATQTSKMQELAKVLIDNGVSPQLVNTIMTEEQKKAPTKEQLQKQILSELSPKLEAATQGLDSKIGEQINPYFNQLIGGIGTINENQKLLQQGIHQLYTGSVELSKGTSDLSNGMSQLSAGSDKLTNGTGQLAAGSGELKQGAFDLYKGMNQLSAGSTALSSGAGQLADGSNQLKDGTTKLSDGAKELADKLADGAQEASKVHADDKTYNMMAKPVKLDTESVNHVPNYGTGFAPYFLSLGLFVGALLISIVFPLRDTAIAPTSGFNWFAGKFAIMAGVGVIQALLADMILLLGLGLDVQSVPKFIIFSIITSLTFIALIQLLVSVFADAGRFLAIIILIFQLTTSAGTFPLELIPNFLQHFNAFLPMTYSVSGFKAVISSGDFSYMWENTMILLSFLLVFALGTIAYFTLRVRHQYKHAINE
jgi:putative membrane protein